MSTLTITTDTTLTEDYFNTTIIIAADGVTLDGNGHLIVGPSLDVDYVWDPNTEPNTDPYWMEKLDPTTGILLEGRTDVTVKNCRVTGFQYGFFLNGSDGNVIQGNAANDVGTGIWLLWSDGNTVEGNTAIDNEVFGFYILESSWNTFEANTANKNDHFGFWLIETSNVTFRDNMANGNYYGIEFDDSFGNIIQGNTANDNAYGFVLTR